MKYLYSIVGVLGDEVVYDEKEVIQKPREHKRALAHRLKIKHKAEVDLVYKKIANIDQVVKPVHCWY